MPIIIKVNPCGVEEVLIEATSEAWEDMCLSAWPIVRRHLRGLDRDLKKFSVEFLVHSMIEEYKISAIKER